MEIRNATLRDLNAIAEVEAECFPLLEAAPEAEFVRRIKWNQKHFWVLTDHQKIVGFINGFATDARDLTDEMYDHAEMGDESGAWQMIFGLDVIPSCRRQGCGAMLMEKMIEDARDAGRRGVVLTCKEQLIHYYGKFGFQNEGVSPSVHGGVTWYQMRLTF